MIPYLNPREFDAVLAGLRVLQRAIQRGDASAVDEILTHSGPALSVLEIDAMCERLNTSPIPVLPLRIHAAIIEHRNGVDISAHLTEDAARAALETFVRRWWDEEIPGREQPKDGRQTIREYFDRVDSESGTIVACDLAVDSGPVQIYAVAHVQGGLLQDVQTFLDEAAAHTHLEGIVVEHEPDMVEDTGVEVPDGVEEIRRTYRAPNGWTLEVTVCRDLTETEDEVYLEVTPLLRQASESPGESTRLRRVTW